MGWSFSSSWKKASDVYKAVNAGSGGHLKLLAQKATSFGRHLWSVYETTEGKRFIHLALVERQKDGWGYKSLYESEGPCYYDCPVKFFELAGPTEDPGARAWRETVYETKAKGSRTFEVGTRLRLYGDTYTVQSVGKRNSYLIMNVAGRVFTLPAKLVASAELVA